MRSPHAAHNRNGSVITHRTSHLGASRESPSPYAGPDAANQGNSTRFLWTTTEAIRQHAREHAPTRASPSGRLPGAAPGFTSYPASRRPHPPTRSRLERRQASPPLQGTACSRDRRLQTADGRRWKARRRTVAETPWTRRPRWRRRRTRRLSCPSPRRRKSKAHASGGRFPLFKPRDEAHRPRPAPENGRYV